MQYNARKHNPVIRKALEATGLDLIDTHSDKRTYGRRISFEHRGFHGRDITPSARASCLAWVRDYLQSQGVDNATARWERSQSYGYTGNPTYWYRLNIHVTE